MSTENKAGSDTASTYSVEIENIGGIDQCQLELDSGLTILEGRNATNRTSLLSAVNGVLGGTKARLKTDTDEGYVRLDLNDESYRVEYVNENGSTKKSGEPYTENTELVDHFVTLLFDNPIRQITRQGGDLRDLLMRPVDTTEIERRIRDRKQERERVEEQIRELERKRERLPNLRDRLSSKQEDLEEVEEDLEAARRAAEKMDVDRDKASETQNLIDKLEEKRQEEHRLRNKIEHQKDEIDSLREQISQLEDSLSGQSPPEENISRIEQELKQLRTEKRTLSNQIDDLLSIISFNDNLLDEGVNEVVEDDSETDALTDKLVEDDSLVCWTCGTPVQRDDIEERLGSLRGIVQEKRSERNQLESEIDELEESLSDHKSKLNEYERKQRELDNLTNELQHRRSKKEEIESDLEELIHEIEQLEADVEAADDEQADELMEQYERISELEYERGQLQQTIDDLETEIEQLEEDDEKLTQLRDQVTQLDDELESLKLRVEEYEKDIIDQFNTHISSLIDKLSYQNIERVWLERKVDSQESTAGSFELHIVRESSDGAVYEDTIETLSESERELVGLVLALAGYIVHDVQETVPFMLLDSVEAIDRDRLADLLVYIEDQVEYLLAALLPEDAAAISADSISADEI
jgi:chromosome segregation ATPase